MAEKRDFLCVDDFSRAEIENLLDLAVKMRKGKPQPLLAGKTLGMLFFNPSLRTRTSFEVAMYQLGGHCLDISARSDLYELEPEEGTVMDGSAAEHLKDAAQVLSRYLDGLAVRCLPERRDYQRERTDPVIRGYARYATRPVINMESCMGHPCQAVADLLTMRDKALSLEGRRLTLTWVNHPEPQSMAVPNSVLLAATLFGMKVTLSHPMGYELDPEILEKARKYAAQSGGSLEIAHDLQEGVKGAEFVYAKSWGSIKMWEDQERERLLSRSHQEWIVDRAAMDLTDRAWFMHPLPVRRNVAVRDEVLDGDRSIVYDQAENRLHFQKALLVHLLG